MSTTPRTDAIVAPYIGQDGVSVEECDKLLDHARQLERELEELRKMHTDRANERDQALRDRWKWESELEEARKESEDRNQQWAAKSIYASQLEQEIANINSQLASAKTALVKAREALHGHTLACNKAWLRLGGICSCKLFARRLEALTAITAALEAQP